VCVFDRLYTEEEIEKHGMHPWTKAQQPIDAVILQNGDLSYLEFLCEHDLTKVPIFDGRRLFREKGEFNVVYQIGNPTLL
jgi:hypothetical protein